MTAPSSFKFSMKCGTAGAWTEVTDDVLFDEGNIPYQWGRTSGFDQSTRPGLYSVTLKNPTGIYSPDNPLSTLPTPLVEGMGVNWELNGVQRAGTIRSVQPIFADGGVVATAGRVRVTVDDMIGNAARHALGADDLLGSVVQAATGLILYPTTDANGSLGAKSTVGNAPTILTSTGTVTFGGSVPGIPGTAAVLSNAATMLTGGNFSTLTYPTGGMNCYGVWVQGYITIQLTFRGLTAPITLTSTPTSITLTPGTGTPMTSAGLTPGAAHFVAFTLLTTFSIPNWTVQAVAAVDGSPLGAGVSNYAQTSPANITILDDNARNLSAIAISTSDSGSFARLMHTRSFPNETALGDTTATARLAVIAATTPEITLDTVPTMSPAILGTQGGNTTAAAMDEVLRGEQGGMNVVTTGSLLAPVPKIVTYARDRKRAVDLTISMNQIQDKPQFVRALTNTVAYATASGPTESVTYYDPTMPALVGSANTSDQVTLRDHNDLYASASDRLYRGKNVATPILSFQIDARSLDINLWTQLMALRPGHRVHITDCLQLNLGYATWDGWAVGGDELHTGETRSLFTIYVQPAWDVPVYGTARYAAGAGVMTLQSNISAGATSLGIVSTGDLYTTNGAHFPQNITIGTGPKAEIVTLSAVSGASSPQTGTISARGVGIVPATAWTAGAAIDVSPLWRYDY